MKQKFVFKLEKIGLEFAENGLIAEIKPIKRKHAIHKEI